MISAGALAGRIRTAFGGAVPARLGVAVSGGGDSLALLHILAECFPNGETELFTATVDHGLRPEAAAEADQHFEIFMRMWEAGEPLNDADMLRSLAD